MGRRVRKRKAGKGARGTDGWPLRCWEDGDPLKNAIADNGGDLTFDSAI